MVKKALLGVGGPRGQELFDGGRRLPLPQLPEGLNTETQKKETRNKSIEKV